ncbi:hypothetical protein BIW19_26390 [Pseudomonas putida]|nr:hypothetical protein BIW19_26390 [Pseudomonas putida]
MATHAMTMATASGMTMGGTGTVMIIAVAASATSRMTVGTPTGGGMVTGAGMGGVGTDKGGAGSDR